MQSQEWFHFSIIYDASSFGTALTNQFKTLMSSCTDTEEEDSLFRSACVEHFYQISFFDNTNSDTVTLTTNSKRESLAKFPIIIIKIWNGVEHSEGFYSFYGRAFDKRTFRIFFAMAI